MKTLDKYVVREMVVPFVAGFAVVLVLLIGNIVYNNIGIIVSRLGQWPDVLYFVLLQSPYFVMLALPAGALFGCSLAISRLTRDSEITMIRMAGVSVKRIFLPIFIVGILISGVAYLFQECVTVWAERESAKVLARLWIAPGPPPIEANVVFTVDNYSFYCDTVDRRNGKLVLGDVTVWERPGSGGFPTLTTAKIAVEENKVWVLKDGTTMRINKDGDPELMGRFKKMKLDLRRPLNDYLITKEKTPRAMTLAQLRSQMRLLDKTGLKTDQYKLEFAFKLAIPLSSLVLMLCVSPLSLMFGRGGGFVGVLIGIVVLFFYWNVILFSRVLGETGALSPSLAGWSEVIVFSIIGGLLLWKVE